MKQPRNRPDERLSPAEAAGALEISASRFKARCLALIDEVAATGVPLVVTKRGKPIAQLVPLDAESSPSLLGSVRYASEEDLLTPVDETWDADR